MLKHQLEGKHPGQTFKFDTEFEWDTYGLLYMAFIDRNTEGHFSIHRLVQEAFRYWCDKDQVLQHFAAAVHIMHQSFPHQLAFGERMADSDWERCRELIEHGQTLATRFKELQNRFPDDDIEAPDEFLKLLESCAWYLRKMGDTPAAIVLGELLLNEIRRTNQRLRLGFRPYRSADQVISNWNTSLYTAGLDGSELRGEESGARDNQDQ